MSELFTVEYAATQLGRLRTAARDTARAARVTAAARHDMDAAERAQGRYALALAAYAARAALIADAESTTKAGAAHALADSVSAVLDAAHDLGRVSANLGDARALAGLEPWTAPDALTGEVIAGYARDAATYAALAVEALKDVRADGANQSRRAAARAAARMTALAARAEEGGLSPRALAGAADQIAETRARLMDHAARFARVP